MKLSKHFLIIFLFLIGDNVFAQDSSKTLSPLQLVELVRRYHPVARQANIIIEKSKADITISKGLFDPYLKTDIAQKTFDGLDYYYYQRPELTIPTWFGIELSAGIEKLSGNRTSPEETKGETNYLGISIPLAKNLLIDKRRAALKMAKIFRDASEIEKRNIMNNLLFDAIKAYWNWTQQYQVYQILVEAVNVNIKRVELVRLAYKLGDRPAIDTTEAIVQLQNFELLRNQAFLDFQNSALELSVYLWTSDSQPFILAENTFPAINLQLSSVGKSTSLSLSNLLDEARKNHPELAIYNFKLQGLSVEKKLKFQELLPAINFRYNQLGKGYDMLKTVSAPLLENNFQYGLSIGIPLRFSQGRGEYQKAKLKISETQLQQAQKLVEIENKVKSYYNEMQTLKNQVALQEKVYTNYLQLQKGEETRFQSGESSLFLINARESKTLEAQQKLQELKAKYFKAEVAIQWITGALATE